MATPPLHGNAAEIKRNPGKCIYEQAMQNQTSDNVELTRLMHKSFG